MTHMKYLLKSLVLVAGVGVLLTVPAAALTSTTLPTDSTEKTTMPAEHQSKAEAILEATESAKKEAKDKARALVSQERAANKVAKTAEQKKLSCEKRQAGFQTKAQNYAKYARKHYDTFVALQTKIENFYNTKHLQVADYESLLGKALTARDAAEANVRALESFNTTLDCTAGDPAQQVATLKTALSTARTSLQEYRTKLRDIVTALKGASTAAHATQETTTEEATQ
ncbi:MAG: hypothetical protein WAQ24_02965 [Candidatus Saccharimonadales bacterium]